jgi:hypothetical protein
MRYPYSWLCDQHILGYAMDEYVFTPLFNHKIMKFRLLLFTWIGLSLAAPAQRFKPAPEWLKTAAFYQMFPALLVLHP